MKKNLLFLLLATPLLFASCAKKKCCDFPVTKDFIVVQKAGTQALFNPLSLTIVQDTFIVSGRNNVAGQEETFGFRIRLDGLGYYTLKSNEGYYHVTKDNEKVGTYKLSSTHSNTVTIVSYNGKDKILQGLFDFKYVKIYDNPAGSQPDSISFLDGKFKVSLHN